MDKNFFLVKERNLRESKQRFDSIIKNIDQRDGSYLDIGSQLGYFVFKMSSVGFFSTGIECSEYPHKYASSLSIVNNTHNANFINMCVDDNNIRNIPSYDVISILNVFHHLVYFLDFDSADTIMKEIARKTNNILIFESGEFGERDEYWSDCLKFMGEHPKEWIYDYLMSLGFSSVERIGEFSTHLNSHTRTLYICKK
jgi:hypothetical protein